MPSISAPAGQSLLVVALFLHALFGSNFGCSASHPTPTAVVRLDLEIAGGADPLLPAPALEAHSTLRVGTYNLHGIADRNGIALDLKRLEAVDVWCFQEVITRAGAGVAMGDVAAVLPPGRWYCASVSVNPSDDSPENHEAQVIASRVPIGRADVWPLDQGRAGGKRRAALAVDVSFRGSNVLVVNTDHEPSFFAMRDGNARQVAALARRLEASDAPRVVVAGDFNCAGSLWRLRGNAAHCGEIDAELRGARMTSAGGDGPTFRFGRFGLQLDRVYTRGFEVVGRQVARSATGSDHFPVWCELR